MSEPRVQGGRDDRRSAMARASDARPFKPYVYRGGDTEPAAVTRARERHRALAVAETAGPGPDEGGYEWRREQLLEEGGEWPASPAAAELAVAVVPGPCQRCGELETEIETLRAEIQTLREQVTAKDPAPPPPARCKKCGYLTSTTGHRVMCE